LWRPAPRAAEQRPDVERAGSDPRLGFCRLFYSRATAYVAFLAPKNWVCNQETGLGENMGLEKLDPIERASRTGLEKKHGPGQQGNPKKQAAAH
jgi:hypothetical protein